MSNVIYRITNTINEKVYIGQTINSHKRWITHKHNARREASSYLYRAIQKYGIENFIFEPIFTVLNEDDLDQFEIQFIAEYNSYNNGYNMLIGGSAMRGKNHPKYGTHPTKKTLKKLSKTKLGKLNPRYGKFGSLSTNFKGYYHTPFGILESSYEIKEHTNKINRRSISEWCKNSNKIISSKSIAKSKYFQSLDEPPLGKTYREIGFWFEPKEKEPEGSSSL